MMISDLKIEYLWFVRNQTEATYRKQILDTVFLIGQFILSSSIGF